MKPKLELELVISARAAPLLGELKPASRPCRFHHAREAPEPSNKEFVKFFTPRF